MGALPAAVFLGMLAPALAVAASDSKRANPASAACTLEMVASGTVATIIDGRTFVLADGREVRLPAIEIPALPEPTPSRAAAPAATDAPEPTASDPGEAAADALKGLLAGRPSRCALQNS